jgi:hypothetical protein
MSSGPLSPDNDYNFPPAPAPAVLDREAWDSTMRSISERIRTMEEQRVEVAAVIDELRSFGFDRLNTALVPVIEGVEQTIAEKEAELAALSQAIAAARAEVDELLAGNIPAASVTESETRVFVTPEQKDQIRPLATQAEAIAGLNEDKHMSPSLVAAAIAALGGGFSKQSYFTTSGTFTKDAKAKILIIEGVGGGGSGCNATGATAVGGGGGGAYNFKIVLAADVPDSIAVTVGSGGAAIPAGTSATGNVGSASTVGDIFTARPGFGGSTFSGGTGGALDGSASSGVFSGGGGHGTNAAGSSIKGGAGGGGTTTGANGTAGRAGGLGIDSGGNGGMSSLTAGVKAGDGQFPGGGGGGGSNGAGSGAGAPGYIRIWEIG